MTKITKCRFPVKLPVKWSFMPLKVSLIIISFSSPTLSFIPDLKPSFLQILPTAAFLFPLQNWLHDSQTFTVSSSISVCTFYFFCFTIFSCRFRAVDLSRLMSAFERTLKSIGPRPMSINVMMILGSWNNEWISLFTTKLDETIACRNKRKKEKKKTLYSIVHNNMIKSKIHIVHTVITTYVHFVLTEQL